VAMKRMVSIKIRIRINVNVKKRAKRVERVIAAG
jgi:hypothetical protein